MAVVVTVTDPIVLLPIKPAPLPYNWEFAVQFSSAKISRRGVCIRVQLPGQTGVGIGQTWGLADQEAIDSSGFSKLVRGFLNLVDLHNLWGQTLQFHANYTQPGGGIAPSTASKPLSLQMPGKPFLVSTNLGDQDARIAHVAALPCGATSPPQGVRVFWTNLPSSQKNAWLVGPDNRLTEATAALAFDRFSFWVSALGLPIKASKGIQTGEAFAALIKATFPHPGIAPSTGQLTVAQIAAGVGANAAAYYGCFFWNASRLLFYSTSPGFHEYGPTGFTFLSPAQFAAGQSEGSLWNIRTYPHTPIAYGQPSVV